MRWPWQKREPAPDEPTAAGAIAELMDEHVATLKRVRVVLSEARTTRLMDDYERADRERRK